MRLVIQTVQQQEEQVSCSADRNCLRDLEFLHCYAAYVLFGLW